MTRRARVDAELVRRGLARSRQQAAELIGAGRVRIDGMPAVKPATAVPITASLTVADGERTWVSRGAHKLIGALDALTRRSLQDELLRIWSATGKTMRGSGDHHKIGSPALNHGKMPWR